jgi:hypothetical protein
MTRTLLPLSAAACAIALTIACGMESAAPTSPSAADAGLVADAAADGSTLKATAPNPQSPINGVKPDIPQLALTVANSSMPFASGVALTYRFEIQTPSGQVVYTSTAVAAGASSTTHNVASSANITPDVPYRWRARAEYQNLVGPWSALASFIAPALKGYIRGNELYDPLINGETVGTLHGDAVFRPGVGIELGSQLAYVSYELPETLTEGEFSILVTNLKTNTEGDKTKLMAMSEGYSDIVVNDRRMTIEKRGDPMGVIAWRFISHGDQIDTEGTIEREFREFDPAETYFWQATWRNNFFNVVIRKGGANGPIYYEKGKHFDGRAYDPDPHVIYLGAPVGRSGVNGASVNDVIIRQVWVSGNPRPAFANQ